MGVQQSTSTKASKLTKTSKLNQCFQNPRERPAFNCMTLVDSRQTKAIPKNAQHMELTMLAKFGGHCIFLVDTTHHHQGLCVTGNPKRQLITKLRPLGHFLAILFVFHSMHSHSKLCLCNIN